MLLMWLAHAFVSWQRSCYFLKLGGLKDLLPCCSAPHGAPARRALDQCLAAVTGQILDRESSQTEIFR